MNADFADRPEELLSELSSISRLSRRSLALRLLAHPWKMIYPEFMRITNSTAEVEARTFWGGKIKVVLPEVVSTSIWRYGYFEEDVCLFMLRLLREGMTFIDIGAHFGFFSLLATCLVGKEGRILSFEPTPYTYQQLKRNTAGHSNVATCNCAAFSEEIEIKFYDYGLENCAFNSAFGMRTKKNPFNDEKTVSVKARKIDDVIMEKGYQCVHLIKIDAESSEIHVLNGMTETLKIHRPNVIIEVGDFDVQGVPRSEEIVGWLLERGYLPYEVDNGAFVKHTKQVRYEYGNLLFMPDKQHQ